MVTLSLESRNPMGHVNAENHLKTGKSSGVNGLSVKFVQLFVYIILLSDLHTNLNQLEIPHSVNFLFYHIVGSILG